LPFEKFHFDTQSFKSFAHSFCFFSFAEEITLFAFCLLFLYTILASYPPRLSYKSTERLSCLQDCANTLFEEFMDASIALAGDFNSLDNDDVVSYCAISAIVSKPTQGDDILDRICQQTRL